MVLLRMESTWIPWLSRCSNTWFRDCPLVMVSFTPLDETTMEVTITKGQSLNQVFEHLGSQGIQVDSMRNKTNRLEEIFMEMVE